MSHRIESKQARRAARLHLEQQAVHRRQWWLRGGGLAAVVLIAAALVVIAFVNSGSGPVAMSHASADAATPGVPAVGKLAPNFTLTNAVNGKQVTRASLQGHRTLLFFSEGVTCQACLVQAADLQKSAAFKQTGIRLVSVTTDPQSQLAQAAQQYGITTPMLSDSTTKMSSAYGMLARGGMHMAGEDGHAFMLLSSSGRVLWQRAFQTMYVSPSQLLADMKKVV